MSEQKKRFRIEHNAMNRIPESERQSWYSIALIWVGIMVCVPSLMIGGSLAGGLTFKSLILAIIVGYSLLCLVMSLNGIISSDLGIPSTMATAKGFGDKGASYVSSIIFFIGAIGWFGVQTATCASAFSSLMATFGVAHFPVWLAAIIWGGIMLATSVTGFSFIKWLNYLSMPFLVIVCAYGGWHCLSLGTESVFDYVPAEPIPFSAAISTLFGGMAMGSVIGGDYSRYSKSRAHTVAASFLGILPIGVFLLAIGGIMAINVHSTDIVAIFSGMGFPVLSMLVLILATWTTNTGNSYTAGLAAMKITGLRDELRPRVTLIVGVIGIVLAISGLANALISFINVISAVTPSVAGVMIADYWIIGRGKPENWYRVKGVNWIGVISWVLGSIVALFFSFFSTAIDSIVVTLVAYLILYALFGKTALAGQGRLPLPGEEGSEEQ